MARFASPVAFLATAALLTLAPAVLAAQRPALADLAHRHGAPGARPDGAALDRSLIHRLTT